MEDRELECFAVNRSTEAAVGIQSEGILTAVSQGDRRALSRLLTVMESGTSEDIRRFIVDLTGRDGTRNSHIVGLTGPPGAGKSTLANALARALRGKGSTVAVIAIDPSSPRSGGAVLGDRVRMRGHATDPGVFIRSFAARGHLGGLALTTPLVVAALEFAGFDFILLETVGVGQSEVDVSTIAHTTVLVSAPGLGDDVQAAKAGVLEVADIYIVNKADAPGSGRLRAELRAGAAKSRLGTPEWIRPLIMSVATTGEGASELTEQINAHGKFLRHTGGWHARDARRASYLLDRLCHALLTAQLADPESQLGTVFARVLPGVLRGVVDPFSAASRVVLGAGDR